MTTFKQSILIALLFAPLTLLAQGAKNIRLSEILTDNDSSIVDEYGQHKAWIELANSSFSSYNVRGMYLTTDRAVLDKSLSAPERIRLMSIIPNGDSRTLIGPEGHLVFFANSQPAEGKLHLAVSMPQGEPLWVALYNGNGVELIDSVSVPALAADQSYARHDGRWTVKAADDVTPGTENFIASNETKVARFKREDPHGFAMAIMAMGIVFLCLATLWIFFTVFGAIMRHIDSAKKIAHQQPIKPITATVEKTKEIAHRTGNILQEGFDKRGVDMEVYMAVIAMALRQYQDDVHDTESGIITIKPKDTDWDDEYSQMTHFHSPIIPAFPTKPGIPTTPEIH